MLDTLKYVNILESKGFTREQAEAQVSLVREIMDQEFAMKIDLERTESKLLSKLESLELRLIIKMGTLMSLMTGIIIGAIKFL
jgi:hypothetical protein